MVRWLAPDNLLLIKVRGIPMYVYANSAETWIYLARPHEPHTMELFEKSVQPGAQVLDIGAQFGYFSLVAAQQAGPRGQVYAFEPASANFQLLERNIQLNGYDQIIHPIPKAVGDKLTTVTFFLYEDSDSHGMYRHPQAAVEQTVLVECVTVDEFLAGQPVDVIKMDIEGNEPYALEGMRQTISRSRHLTMFVEFAPAYLRRAGVEPDGFLAQLANLGFQVQLIDEKARCLRSLENGSFQEDDPAWYVNLYCTKK